VTISFIEGTIYNVFPLKELLNLRCLQSENKQISCLI